MKVTHLKVWTWRTEILLKCSSNSLGEVITTSLLCLARCIMKYFSAVTGISNKTLPVQWSTLFHVIHFIHKPVCLVTKSLS